MKKGRVPKNKATPTKERPGICACGFKLEHYPHSVVVCHPSLPGRLRKLAAYYTKKGQFNVNLSTARWDLDHFPPLTAFPKLVYERQSIVACVHCGRSMGDYWDYEKGKMRDDCIRLGIWLAQICNGCLQLQPQICPVTFEYDWGCHRFMANQLSMCLKRAYPRVSRDLRRYIAKIICGRPACPHGTPRYVKKKDPVAEWFYYEPPPGNIGWLGPC